MTDGFWSNPNKLASPQSLLTLNSVGDQQRGPTGFIPGTSAGAIPDTYTREAQAVYPWGFNYSEPARKAEYEDLYMNKLGQFSSWHSVYQAEFITYRASGRYAIPSPVTGINPPDAVYIVSTDGRTVINIMNLTVADYQRLSAADKAKLESDGFFTDFTARTLGLVARASSGIQTNIDSLRSEINGFSTPNSVPPADRDVFLGQLDLLQRRLNESVRVVPSNFANEIGLLAERFKRAREFANQQPEMGLTTIFQGFADEQVYTELQTDVKGYVISSDNGQTVKIGYQTLMRAEREMLTAQLRREALSRNTQIFDPKADVAQLIYQLQLQYQSEADARSDAGTEEMAQLHRLLSDYAIMQRLINETLKAFNPTKQDEKRRFMNIGAKSDGSVHTDQTTPDQDPIRITYRFDNGVSFVLGTGEKTKGIDQFAEGPGYHWYVLAGAPGDSRIGDGVIRQLTFPSDSGVGQDKFLYDSNGDGNPNGEVYNYFRGEDPNVVVKTGGLSAAEMRIVGMFSKDPWGSGDPSKTNMLAKHPIEALYGVTRPTSLLSDDTKDGFGSLRLERRDYWDKWGTQLSDSVTLLNQKNQLKQNEIESATKESNRHFDLGNNALRKMNEMLMSIGRM
jgi:hypothetical protein